MQKGCRLHTSATMRNVNYPRGGALNEHNLIERATKCTRSDKKKQTDSVADCGGKMCKTRWNFTTETGKRNCEKSFHTSEGSNAVVYLPCL